MDGKRKGRAWGVTSASLEGPRLPRAASNAAGPSPRSTAAGGRISSSGVRPWRLLPPAEQREATPCDFRVGRGGARTCPPGALLVAGHAGGRGGSGGGSPSTWRGHGWRLWPAVLARPRCSHPGPDAQLGRASSGPGCMSQSKPTEPLFPGGAPDAADQGQPWAGPLRPTESLLAPAAECEWLLLQRRDRDVSLGRRARGRAASESWRRRRDWRGAGVSGAGRRRGPDSQVWASGQRCWLSLRQSD